MELSKRPISATTLTQLYCSRINEEVIIRLKWGQTEYKGRLVSVDSYMNVQLNETEEFINRKSTGTLGQVLIRYARKIIKASATLGREYTLYQGSC